MIRLNDLTPDARKLMIDEIISNEELKDYRDQITIKDLDDWLSRQPETMDVYCPACQTKMKRYQYKFDLSFLITLVAILKVQRINKAECGVEGCHYEQIKPMVRKMGFNYKTTRFRVMRHREWGLIKKVTIRDFIDDETVTSVIVNIDGRSEEVQTGFWAVDYNGFQFMRGKLKIPEWIKTFNNNVYEVSDKLIGLNETPKLTQDEMDKMKKPI